MLFCEKWPNSWASTALNSVRLSRFTSPRPMMRFFFDGKTRFSNDSSNDTAAFTSGMRKTLCGNGAPVSLHNWRMKANSVGLFGLGDLDAHARI